MTRLILPLTAELLRLNQTVINQMFETVLNNASIDIKTVKNFVLNMFFIGVF